MRRAFKWTLRAFLALLAAGALIWVGTNIYANIRLAAVLAETRAAGLPVGGADLARDLPPPEENGAPLYRAALELLGAVPRVDETWERYQGPLCGGGDASVPEAVRSQLPRFDEVRALLRRAAERPSCVFPFDVGGFPDVPLVDVRGMMELGKVLWVSALASAGDGDVDAALVDVHTLFRLAESLRDEPFLLGQMVRIALLGRACDAAVVVLREAPDPAGALERLGLPDVRGACARGLEGEVAFAISTMDEHVIEPPLPMIYETGDPPFLLEHLPWLVFQPWAKLGLAEHLGYQRRLLELMARPYPEAIAESARALVDAREHGSIFMEVFAIGLSPLLENEARVAAQLALLGVGSRLLAHVREHGAYPRGISELPGAAAVLDPASGQPFVLLHDAGAVTIESVAEGARWRLPAP